MTKKLQVIYRKCMVCGNQFATTEKRLKVTCSPTCRKKYRIGYTKKRRSIVPEKVRIYEYNYRHREDKHCPVCGVRIVNQSTTCPKHLGLLIRGDKHYSWKGGKCRHQGYLIVKRPEHPRAWKKGGYVFEHILIWEKCHGKPLPKGWIIHHLNGKKDDNRIENLVALPNKTHYLVLQAKAKRIQELEALLNGQTQLI